MQADLRIELPDGTQIGYAETGDAAGQPVMYLHGTPSSRLEIGLPGIREIADELGLRVIAADRPGIGLSPYRRYSVAEYPHLVRHLADALELERFALIGVSGGGKYACACAWALPDRVTRVALVSSTCSFDLPGARATWSREDGRLYRAANLAPWVVRLVMGRIAHDVRRDPDSMLGTIRRSVGSADLDVLAVLEFREALARDMAQAYRQGGRGAAHDLTLEARPWGVPLDRIGVPVHLWHGEADQVVSADQGRILARSLPLVTEHYVPGEGHFSLFAHHARAILQTLIQGGDGPGSVAAP